MDSFCGGSGLVNLETAESADSNPARIFHHTCGTLRNEFSAFLICRRPLKQRQQAKALQMRVER
jgi:hypothetical protein